MTRPRPGFSLVELITALLLVAIGLLAIASAALATATRPIATSSMAVISSTSEKPVRRCMLSTIVRAGGRFHA